MFHCPHCGKPIETSPGVPQQEDPRWLKLVHPKKVSIGFGSLVAIAITVALCSGVGSRGTSEIRSDIRDLDRKISHLGQMVQELREGIARRDERLPQSKSVSGSDAVANQ